MTSLATPAVAALTMLASLFAVQQAYAQTAERTPQAALADLSDGLVSDPGLFTFRGCPQEDPLGRAIFEAVRDVDLSGLGSVQMVLAFALWSYPGCGYAALNEWIVEMVERWHGQRDASSLEYFVSGLSWPERVIERDLQEALLRAAADEQFGSEGTRHRVADAALRYRPPERRMEEVMASFTISIPDLTKTGWTYELTRTYGAEFFRALAAVAPSYSDDQLFTIVSAIGTEVRNGRVAPNLAGLGQLRAEISRRPDLPPWAEIPEQARIVPHSHEPPPGR